MTTQEFQKYLNKFCLILNQSNFTKEEFLFHSKPYMAGFSYIFNKIASLPLIKEKTKVLDFGCGTGLTTFLLANLGFNTTGIDIYNTSEEIQNAFIQKGKNAQQQLWTNITKFKKNSKFIFYDGLNLPFENQQFDLILAHAVLEHIPPKNFNKILTELTRVIKPEGYLVVARTPNKYAFTEFLAKSHDIKFSKQAIIKPFEDLKYRLIHYEKTDYFPEIAPGKLQNILNFFTPITKSIDHILNKTPLEILSHHHFIILQRSNS